MSNLSLPGRGGRPLLSMVCAAVLGLGACSSAKDPATLPSSGLLDRLTPYKVEILQGNVVTRELIEQIKPGMPREEVRELLGSPMLTDVFHAARWDFMFSISRGAETRERRAVTVHFEGDRVSRVEAPDLPSENDFVASLSRKAPPVAKELPLELTPEQRARLPVPLKRESVAAPQPQGAVRNYPPLERP